VIRFRQLDGRRVDDAAGTGQTITTCSPAGSVSVLRGSPSENMCTPGSDVVSGESRRAPSSVRAPSTTVAGWQLAVITVSAISLAG
jgi:hypothetical protein